MAPDAVECCCLARSLALQLADGLKQDTSAVADEADQVNMYATAGMSGEPGKRNTTSEIAVGIVTSPCLWLIRPEAWLLVVPPVVWFDSEGPDYCWGCVAYGMANCIAPISVCVEPRCRLSL